MTQPVPFDPSCERYAAEMTDYDTHVTTSMEEWEEFLLLDDATKGRMRADYVRREEGTFNRENGHFLCDRCYISHGMPLGVCP